MDRATNDAVATFTVTRDAADPTLSLSAVSEGTDIALDWNASDAGSGLATCTLQYRMDEGAWQPHSGQCAGTETFDAQSGHTYTFRLSATDNVSNEAQTEAGAFTTAVTKYYYFGGKRVAMRGPDETVVWLHGDHLGSTSLATSAAGEMLSRQLYYPFGGTRWTSVASLPTDFQFTRQRIQSTIALYDYHARFYDPQIGRFVQADTVVPEPGNPQDFNRYSYVRNNPLKFTDPSGHQCTIEYDPFTGSYGGKSCFGDQTGMGRTQEINEKNPGSGCRSAAECKENEGKLVKLIWSLLVISFAPGAAAEAGLIGAGATVASAASADGDPPNEIAAVADLGAQAVEAIIADGDPTNEITSLAGADLPAIERFAQEAIDINIARGYISFGQTWEWLSRSMLQLGNESRMFIARQGSRIAGMMQVKYAEGMYMIERLEGIGGGAGTALFKQAISDSMAKGFGGSLYWWPVERAVEWYLRIPGVQILEDGMFYLPGEAAQRFLGGN